MERYFVWTADEKYSRQIDDFITRFGNGPFRRIRNGNMLLTLYLFDTGDSEDQLLMAHIYEPSIVVDINGRHEEFAAVFLEEAH